jgi:hypothetical protein
VERRDLVVMLLVSTSETLALFGCHDVNETRYLAHFFTVTFGALRLRFFVLSDGFDALEGFAAFFTAILVGRHVSPPTLPIKWFQ